MALDVSIWTWPDSLIIIVATIALALLARVLIAIGIRQVVKATVKRAEKHHRDKPTRSQRLLADAGLAVERTRQRAETLGTLLRSISTLVIIVIALLMIMSTIGLPLGPLLASAGVGGIALGFGAQSLVKDFLSGLFMIAEDQYGVGDYIDAGDVTGTVEDVTLRITRIRDASGQVWYVPNGQIKRIGNLSQGWSTAFVDIPVNYDEDPGRALGVLQTVVDDIDNDPQWTEVLLDKPQVLGVESVTGQTMLLRIMIKTEPNQQWGVQRDIRERAKDALAAAGVKGPLMLSLPTGNEPS